MTLYRKNGLRNFSIQDPTVGKKLQSGEVLAFSGTNNIKYTLFPGGIIGSDLLPTGVTAGTYGSSTMVPVITVDIFGRITVITEVAVSGGGGGGVTSVGAGTGMSFTTITGTGNVSIDTTKVPYLASGFSTGLLKWNGSAWVFDNSSYITASALVNYVQNTRQIATSGSLTGGGDLSADRTLSLVNDSASPGNQKYYGTDLSGTKGFHSFPSGNYAVILKAIGGTAVTGTTSNVISLSGLVPGGTNTTNDILRVKWRISKTGTAGTFTARLYVNTTNSLTGATLLGFATTAGSATTRLVQMDRELLIINNTSNTQVWNVAVSIYSDTTGSTAASWSNIAIDHTVDQYYFIAIQNTANGDSTVVDFLRIERT